MPTIVWLLFYPDHFKLSTNARQNNNNDLYWIVIVLCVRSVSRTIVIINSKHAIDVWKCKRMILVLRFWRLRDVWVGLFFLFSFKILSFWDCFISWFHGWKPTCPDSARTSWIEGNVYNNGTTATMTLLLSVNVYDCRNSNWLTKSTHILYTNYERMSNGRPFPFELTVYFFFIVWSWWFIC
jgi:hypothetical protein